METQTCLVSRVLEKASHVAFKSPFKAEQNRCIDADNKKISFFSNDNGKIVAKVTKANRTIY